MPNGTIDPHYDYVADLDIDSGRRWPTIRVGQAHADELQQLLFEHLKPFTSADVDLVVFGSLARREWTTGSDVDWTLLVDGQANSQHRAVAREVAQLLGSIEFRGEKLNKPGAEGIFGSMVFSHDIVHHIGGQADTNRNTTQRILLLLEAAALRGSGAEVTGPCERIARQVLNRYLASDSNFHSVTDGESRIPRFLLNDIVRFWRTMCVDFAYKDWEQAGSKWALRNLKLRTSRKLLFVAGLFTVFSCFQNDHLRRDEASGESPRLKMQSHLMDFVHSTPLNIVAWTLGELGLLTECRDLFDCYEEFLARLNDVKCRANLAKLKEQDVYQDSTFLECRDVSHRLQAILKNICFSGSSQLVCFIAEYGVF